MHHHEDLPAPAHTHYPNRIAGAFNLLAAFMEVGRGLGILGHVASFSLQVGCRGDPRLGGSFVDATSIPGKRGAAVGKTKRGKGTKYLWWSMAKIFLWQAMPTLPRQLRSRSSRRLWQTVQDALSHTILVLLDLSMPRSVVPGNSLCSDENLLDGRSSRQYLQFYGVIRGFSCQGGFQ